jgi:putative ABC transport system substrate-binding protein
LRRREFIKVIAASTAGWPLAARAQQSAMPVIGFLGPASPVQYAQLVAAFRQGLDENGYAEGKNVAIEFRWAEYRRNVSSCGTGCKSSDEDNPDRLRGRRRSGRR